MISRFVRLKIGALALCALLLGGSHGQCQRRSWALWDAYAAHFIDAQGRVIDHQGGDRTTSEGQSYALFLALVENDRVRFDRLLSWTRDNMADGDMSARLPGWLWGRGNDGRWKTQDPNPASDSDCWIAYSLLEAGRLWKAPAYTALGRRMLRMIADQEVADLPGLGKMLMPGPLAAFMHGQRWTLNPSYLPVFLFTRFAAVDPAGPWLPISRNIPRVLAESAVHNFAMDWVDYTPTKGFAPAPGPGKNNAAPVGSYDAIRVYLWAGMLDSGSRARAGLPKAIAGMAVYLGSHPAPPEKITAQGAPLAQDGPVGFSAALLPYLAACRGAYPGMDKSLAQQRARVSAQWDASTGLYGKGNAYFDQNLVLLATGFMDGRFRFGPNGLLKVEWTR